MSARIDRKLFTPIPIEVKKSPIEYRATVKFEAPPAPQLRSQVVAAASFPDRTHARLSRWREHTWAGLTGPLLGGTGLPIDRIKIDAADKVVERTPATSPTNIGLFLAAIAVQKDRGVVPREKAEALAEKALAALENLSRDSRGFFANWYDADDGTLLPQTGRGLNASGELVTVEGAGFVSSVDNGNLMIALEALAHAFAASPKISAAAERILEPMRRNFAAAFLDRGFVNLGYFWKEDQTYLSESRYDRLGSEARSIVAVLEAQGFLPSGTLEKMASNAAFAEYSLGKDPRAPKVRVFKTWDGGIFQWLLPNVLLGETKLSPEFLQHHRDLIDVLFAEGRGGFPAAYSACDHPGGGYEGKSGVAVLAEDAEHVRSGVITPHALFLLSQVVPERAAAALTRLEALHPNVMREGLGFADAVDEVTGEVADTILSLDQLMSLLAGPELSRHVRARVPALEAVYSGLSLG